MTLPNAFAPMLAYKQFLLWKSVPKDNGKTDKFPVDPNTMQVCNAHDPNTWVDGHTACAMAATTDMGVAFVFTANDPFFFLDIDNCLQSDGTWSPLALELLGLLPGALVEVSQSGTGLHVFGQTQPLNHGCKLKVLDLEFYTSLRFAALTGTNVIGDSGIDCTAGITQIVNTYFPPTEAAALIWTDTPCEGWEPIDDSEIIKRATSSQSAGAVFGSKASFKDLWEGNTLALTQSYPDGFGERQYDESSADAALAQHLAFWTGKNCEHIKRMMFGSALVRDKWTKRDDYLRRTIAGAVAKSDQFYGSNKLAAVQETVVDATNMQQSQVTPGQAQIVGAPAILAVTQQIEWFAGCTYVRDQHKIFTPDGSLLKPEQFKATYGGYLFVMDSAGEKTSRNAWEVFTESQAIRFPKAHGMCFRPERAPGELIEDDGRWMVNTYTPVVVPRVAGDVSPWLNHLKAMLPDPQDFEIMLSYMAAVVQYPGVKFQWAPVIQGCEGNGKTLFISSVSAAVGSRYTHLPNAQDLGGNGSKFNSWIMRKLFIGIEEIYVGDRREVADALKPLITNSRIEIQGKGKDQVTGDNRANFILCTNHRDAILKNVNDRRYCVLYTAQQSVEDLQACGWLGTDYFPKLYNWFWKGGSAIVAEYLHTYQISEKLNPATTCHRAPRSSSTDEAIKNSVGPVEQEILEAIDEGRAGFAGGWISSVALNRLLEEKHKARFIPPNKRRELLNGIGYDYHPALPNGRATSYVTIDGARSRLFIKKGSIQANITEAGEVVKAYEKAQNTVSIQAGVATFGGQQK